MKISVTNFRGMNDLRVTLDKILLIGGSNAAGKSSACSAIGAAMSGDMLPFEGMTKGKAALLVRRGVDVAAVTIETDEGAVVARWPSVERETRGAFKDASAMAMGIEDLTKMKAGERAAALLHLIDAVPVHADFQGAFSEAGLRSKELLDEVWKQIETRGWDGAHAARKESGAKLKGKWEQVTGERFGLQKAAGWRPVDWPMSQDATALDDLEKAVETAQGALDAAQRGLGASETQLASWKMEADLLPKARQALADAKEDVTKAEARATAASKALAALGPRPSPGDAPLSCPCCKGAVRLRDGVLIQASAVDHQDQLAAQAKWDEAEAAAKKTEDGRLMAARYASVAEANVGRAEAASASLKLESKGETTAEDVAAAKGALQAAQRVLADRRRIVAAGQHYEDIVTTVAIVGLLAPEGLRQSVLVDRLGEFNGLMVDICKRAKWPPVHIDANMGLTFDGNPASLCSESEMYRVRCVVRLAIASFEQAPLVIFDGADILDKAGRNGLIKAIKAAGIPAIIGMTILDRADLPDLAKAGMGESVWIEEGRIAAPVEAV